MYGESLRLLLDHIVPSKSQWYLQVLPHRRYFLVGQTSWLVSYYFASKVLFPQDLLGDAISQNVYLALMYLLLSQGC